MISARDLIRVLRFPLLEVSDWISLARASHLDYGAVAEVSLYLAGGSCEVSHSSIHPSAWNSNSRKFISKILHTHTPTPPESPTPGTPHSPGPTELVTPMDRYARSWMFFLQTNVCTS